jgi:hypothetical protein
MNQPLPHNPLHSVFLVPIIDFDTQIVPIINNFPGILPGNKQSTILAMKTIFCRMNSMLSEKDLISLSFMLSGLNMPHQANNILIEKLPIEACRVLMHLFKSKLTSLDIELSSLEQVELS